MFARLRPSFSLAAWLALPLAVAFLGLAPAGCRNGRSGAEAGGAVAPAGAAVVLHAEARAIPIRVEVAATEADRERGLMYRNHLDPDAGMLFLFPRLEPLTFWMKNTLIPLDMIFIDDGRRIVGIVENAAPETETPRRVNGQSQYVLEIAGGMSRRLGVTAGSVVEFRGVPPTPPPN
jgi:uncharacterized membrane protein (UPF0127 family)